MFHYGRSTTPTADDVQELNSSRLAEDTSSSSHDDFASKLSPEADLGIGITIILSTILSIAGNGIVLVVYYKKRRTANSFDLLTVNIAFSDILYAACGHWVHIHSSLHHEWLYGTPSCQAYGFLSSLLNYVSIVTLSVLAVTRYLKVCSHTLDKLVKRSNAIKAIVLIWLYSLVWALPPLVGWNRYVPEPFGISCTLDWTSSIPKDGWYTVSLFIFIFIIPLVTIIVCYGYIIFKTSYQRRVVERSSRRFLSSPRIVERRLTKTAIAMTMAFFISWGPYAIVSLWAVIYGHIPPIPMISMALVCTFAKLSTVYNPILVVLLNRKFRRHLLIMLNRCGLCSSSCCSYRVNFELNITCNRTSTVKRIDDQSTTRTQRDTDTKQSDFPQKSAFLPFRPSWPRLLSVTDMSNTQSEMDTSMLPNIPVQSSENNVRKSSRTVHYKNCVHQIQNAEAV